MSALLTGVATSILLPVAQKVGASVLKTVLAKAGVKGFDDVVDGLVETVADRIGVRPLDLPNTAPAAIEQAVRQVEADAPLDPAVMDAYNRAQELSHELQRAEMTTEPSWTWAWRPAWMWLLALIWLYALVLRPIANAAFGATIEAVDLSMLMTLTGAYLALYMGGHTAKEIAAKVKKAGNG